MCSGAVRQACQVSRARCHGERWFSCIRCSTGAARQARCSRLSRSAAAMGWPARSTHKAPMVWPAATSGRLATEPGRPPSRRCWACRMRGCTPLRGSGHSRLADWSTASDSAARNASAWAGARSAGTPCDTANSVSSSRSSSATVARVKAPSVASAFTQAAAAGSARVCDSSTACSATAAPASGGASARRGAAASTTCRGWERAISPQCREATAVARGEIAGQIRVSCGRRAAPARDRQGAWDLAADTPSLGTHGGATHLTACDCSTGTWFDRDLARPRLSLLSIRSAPDGAGFHFRAELEHGPLSSYQF